MEIKSKFDIEISRNEVGLFETLGYIFLTR